MRRALAGDARRPIDRRAEPGPPATTAGWLFQAATAAVLAIAVALGWRIAGPRSIFRDRTNDPFYQAVAADRRGLTVTAGSFQLVQLYTRRPVLIDSGALDTMVYAPEGGPATARIVTDVYGIDFYRSAAGDAEQLGHPARRQPVHLVAVALSASAGGSCEEPIMCRRS